MQYIAGAIVILAGSLLWGMGALGLIMLGLVNVNSQLSFIVGSLGGTISTAMQPGGRLFLANLDVENGQSPCFSTNLAADLYRQGSLVSHATYFDLCPEPSALFLVGAGLLGLSLVRGRSQIGI